MYVNQKGFLWTARQVNTIKSEESNSRQVFGLRLLDYLTEMSNAKGLEVGSKPN